jgi:hypothetical protein
LRHVSDVYTDIPAEQHCTRRPALAYVAIKTTNSCLVALPDSTVTHRTPPSCITTAKCCLALTFHQQQVQKCSTTILIWQLGAYLLGHPAHAQAHRDHQVRCGLPKSSAGHICGGGQCEPTHCHYLQEACQHKGVAHTIEATDKGHLHSTHHSTGVSEVTPHQTAWSSGLLEARGSSHGRGHMNQHCVESN